jgi:signal peptidase I
MTEQQLPLNAAVAVPGRHVIAWRRTAGVLGYAAVLAALAVWFVGFRPEPLGGPASYVMVAGTSMLPTLRTGDVVVVRRQSAYRVGDIVAYRIPKGQPAAGGRVIHRIVGGSGTTGYVLRGDNRKSNDLWRPRNADVLGKVVVRLPHAARFARILRSPLVLASLAAGLVFAFVVGSGDDVNPTIKRSTP